MVVHIFNPDIQKAEADGSLSLRPALSTELVSGQPNLGSEGNHGKQKAADNVLE